MLAGNGDEGIVVVEGVGGQKVKGRVKGMAKGSAKGTQKGRICMIRCGFS